MGVSDGNVHGAQRCHELVRRSRTGRTSVSQRYNHLHRGDPVAAFIVGGVGAFLGDLLFYPAPMFVSLVTHGLQAIIISVFSHYVLKKHPVLASGIGVSIGAVIMVVGYSLGRAFIYSTPEYALMKLPFQFLQAAVGAVAGMLLCWKCGVYKLYNRALAKAAGGSRKERKEPADKSSKQ